MTFNQAGKLYKWGSTGIGLLAAGKTGMFSNTDAYRFQLTQNNTTNNPITKLLSPAALLYNGIGKGVL